MGSQNDAFLAQLSDMDNTTLVVMLAFVIITIYTVCTRDLTKKLLVFDAGVQPKLPTKELIKSRLLLARLSYCTSHLTDQGSLEVHGGNPFPDMNTVTLQGSPYKVIATGMEDAVWLLERQDDARTVMPRWFLLVRGTVMGHDLLSDIQLTQAVAHDTDLKHFEEVVRLYHWNVLNLFREFGVMKSDSIELVGHSLGGCICEALLMSSNYERMTAFVFDTPGTPDSFRQKHAISERVGGLSTLNSIANVVNTLTRPVASKFWVCGNGSNVPLKFPAMLWLRNGISLAGFANYAISSHELTEIQRYVELGDVRAADARQWPLYSGWLVKKIFMIKKKIIYSTKSNISRSCGSDYLNVKKYNLPSNRLSRKGNLEQVPNDLSDVTSGVAYEVRDYKKFIGSVDPERHMIIPLVGITSVGKTSVFKAIMDMAPNDATVLVSTSRINATNFPAVMRCPQPNPAGQDEPFELFIMDMPGVNGKEAAEVQEFLQELLVQLDLLKEAIQVCCLVLGDAVTQSNVRMFEGIHGILENRIMVVRNIKDFDEPEAIGVAHDETKEKLERKVSWVGDLVVQDVRLRRAPGGKSEQEEGVEELKKQVMDFARGKYEHNMECVMRAREDAQKEKGPRFLNRMAALGSGRVGGRLAKKRVVPLVKKACERAFSSTTQTTMESGGTVTKTLTSKVLEKSITTTSSVIGGLASGALSLPIGLSIDCMRCALGGGPPSMKKQFVTRLNNTPNQMCASAAGAMVGTMVCPGVGTQVGMMCGSLASSVYLDEETE